MTPEILTGLMRSVLLFISASLASHGIKIIDGGTFDALAGALSALILVGFSIRAKLILAKKIEAVSAPPVTVPTETKTS